MVDENQSLSLLGKGRNLEKIDEIHGNSKYSPELKENAKNYCLLTNATVQQLADYLEVSVPTLLKWKKEYPDFSLAIQEGKLGADIAVASGLQKRARGYRYEEVKIEKGVSDGFSFTRASW